MGRGDESILGGTCIAQLTVALPVIHYPLQVEVNNMMIHCRDMRPEPVD